MDDKDEEEEGEEEEEEEHENANLWRLCDEVAGKPRGLSLVRKPPPLGEEGPAQKQAQRQPAFFPASGV